jgi:hypothetical protein
MSYKVPRGKGKLQKISKGGGLLEEFGEMLQAGRSGSALKAERNYAEIRAALSLSGKTQRDSPGSRTSQNDSSGTTSEGLINSGYDQAFFIRTSFTVPFESFIFTVLYKR